MFAVSFSFRMTETLLQPSKSLTIILSNTEVNSYMPSTASTETSSRTRILLLVTILLLGGLAWILRESIGGRGQAFFGVLFFIGLAAACSDNLGNVNWRTIATGLALQFMLGVLILKVDIVYSGFEVMGAMVAKFLEFANVGSEFVFGPLANHLKSEGAFGVGSGFIFAVRALPTVIFISAVFTVMYHLRILQAIVWFFAKAMLLIFGSKGVSGAETLAATANVFMGQTEAPLIIKPYVATMTRSELLALMIAAVVCP